MACSTPSDKKDCHEPGGRYDTGICIYYFDKRAMRVSSPDSPGLAEQNAYLEVGDGALVAEFRAMMIWVVACRRKGGADWYKREAVWRAWQPGLAGLADAMTRW